MAADRARDGRDPRWLGELAAGPETQLSDLFVLFCRPTGPHLAAFILPLLGRRSAPCQSCAVLRQTAIRQKSGRASRQHIPCRFVAVVMPTVRCTNVRHLLPGRRKLRRGSCGGCARCLQNERRKAASRQVSVERVRSGVVDSRRQSGQGNIDANEPKRNSTLATENTWPGGAHRAFSSI
jgi:hypothetical protein